MRRTRSVVAALFLVCVAASLIGQSADPLPRRPFLGAALVDNLAGIRITAILPNSPAATAGLHIGDIITSIPGLKVLTAAALSNRIKRQSVTKSTPFQLLRDGKQMTVPVQLAPYPTETDSAVGTIYSSITVDGALRRTLLTVPNLSTGRLPAMLLIGGIGCYTVDNPNDPHDAYRFLAHDLTRAGIIVMRVEKSGIGDSQGGPCFDTDFGSESRNYSVALDTLCADPRVDPQRVFLFGHSIGTLIAPRLALAKPIAGLIIADGVGINWIEYELANLRRQSQLSHDTPAATDDLLRSKETCMHRLLIDRQPEADIERDMPACNQRNVYPVAAPYMQQVAALNIAEPWTKISAPVLILYGTADFITAAAEHRRIADILNAQHPGSAEFKTVQGMDHHLEMMGTPQQAWDARVNQHRSGPYAEQLSSLIKDWICAKTKCS